MNRIGLLLIGCTYVVDSFHDDDDDDDVNDHDH